MKIRKMGAIAQLLKMSLAPRKLLPKVVQQNIDHGSTKMAIANQHGIYSMTAPTP